MSDNVIIEITDPVTEEVVSFEGATEDEAQAKADEYFGVDLADAATS